MSLYTNINNIKTILNQFNHFNGARPCPMSGRPRVGLDGQRLQVTMRLVGTLSRTIWDKDLTQLPGLDARVTENFSLQREYINIV